MIDDRLVLRIALVAGYVALSCLSTWSVTRSSHWSYHRYPLLS